MESRTSKPYIKNEAGSILIDPSDLSNGLRLSNRRIEFMISKYLFNLKPCVVFVSL